MDEYFVEGYDTIEENLESKRLQVVAKVFTFTGTVQKYQVPQGISKISVNGYGGSGGDGKRNNGGLGGQILATITVTPGQLLYIYVGGAGISGCGDGGWNGGGGSYTNWCSLCGTGGGATDIRTVNGDLSSRILVAGAGGGAGDSLSGGGGGLIGQSADGGCPLTAATGGTQTSGGKGAGHWNPNICYYAGLGSSYQGSDGGLGYGGDGSWSAGGGGSGYYGGGGGDRSGAAGGSNYCSSSYCTNVIHYQGVHKGDGSAQITELSSSSNVPTYSPSTNPPTLSPTFPLCQGHPCPGVCCAHNDDIEACCGSDPNAVCCSQQYDTFVFCCSKGTTCSSARNSCIDTSTTSSPSMISTSKTSSPSMSTLRSINTPTLESIKSPINSGFREDFNLSLIFIILILIIR